MLEQTNTEKAKHFQLRVLIFMAIMVTLEVILSRLLSYSVWNIKVGLSFIPVTLAAIMFGPYSAAIVGGVADLIGAIIFPVGSYFPGFTLTAALKGFMFGVFLSKRTSILLIISAVMINQIILSLVLNTYWISILYSTSFESLLLTRIIQSVIMIPIQIIVIYIVTKGYGKYLKKHSNNFGYHEI